MNIGSTFSRYLDIRITIFLSIFFQFLLWYFSFDNIWFISNQKDESILPPRLSNKIQPLIDSIKRRSLTDVNYYKTSICVANVWGNECSKSLLSCCIPELKTKSFTLYLHGFSDKVNTDCRLNEVSDTLAVN